MSNFSVINSFPEYGTRLYRNLSKEKQEKIFSAAVNEFACRGYLNASMNVVVREAGISKGSLFQYFSSKADLFVGIVDIAEEMVREYLRLVRNQTSSHQFSLQLGTLVRSGFAFINSQPQLARIYFEVIQSGETPLGPQLSARLRKRSYDFLGEMIREAVQKGELRADIPTDKTVFILNGILETIMRSLLHGLYGIVHWTLP